MIFHVIAALQPHWCPGWFWAHRHLTAAGLLTTLSVLLPRMFFAHTYTLVVSLPSLGLCSGAIAFVRHFLTRFHSTSHTIPMLPHSILLYPSLPSPQYFISYHLSAHLHVYQTSLSIICHPSIIYLLTYFSHLYACINHLPTCQLILFIWSINHLPAYHKNVRTTKTRSLFC